MVNDYHRFIQPDTTIHTRVTPDIKVPDLEEHPATYITTGLLKMAEELGHLAKQIENTSKPVDEYRVQTLAADTESFVEVLPIFDQLAEKITAIIINGPPGAVTLQLGDRTWPLVIPAAGIIVIAPVAILLTHQDRRVLTPGTPGDYALELMGYADERF